MVDYGSLLTLRELQLAGPVPALAQVGDKLEAALPTQVWERNKSKESDWNDLIGIGDRSFVFDRKPGAGLPRASLFLVASGTKAEVTNIVPIGVKELRPQQYNEILEDFLHSGLQSVADELGLQVRTSDAVRPITAWLSDAAARKLQSFSRLANHATGSAHPKDRERWFAFIIQAHRDGSTLDASTLERWLIEIERWSAEKASDLAIEYEFGRALLKQNVQS